MRIYNAYRFRYTTLRYAVTPLVRTKTILQGRREKSIFPTNSRNIYPTRLQRLSSANR